MRINIYQKALFIFYTLYLIAFCLFFVPYRTIESNYYKGRLYNLSNITYDSLFANHTKIDLYRTLIFILIPSIICIVSILLLNKIQNPDFSNPITKRQIKKELVFISIIVLSLISANLYCIHKNKEHVQTKNFILHHKNQLKDINSREGNRFYFNKVNIRKEFYSRIKSDYKLGEDTTQELFYEHLISLKDSSERLNLLFDKLDDNVKSEFELTNLQTFYYFIDYLEFSEDELDLELLINVNTLVLKDSESYLKGFPYYNRKEMLNFILKTGLIVVLILYGSRFIIYCFNSLFKILK